MNTSNENSPPTTLAGGINPDTFLLAETRRLFDYVATQNFEDLAKLCDDDFGIVDLDPSGGNVVVRDRAGWEDWFHGLFQQLQAMDARTYTRIKEYHVKPGSDLAYSVVYFDQMVDHQGHTYTFDCVATIIWKQDADTGRWVESRWHASMVSPPPQVGS